jgi:CelD/BcsL family acetyltransferase involved in cellulose biosynthesis
MYSNEVAAADRTIRSSGIEPVTTFSFRIAYDLSEFAGLWPRTDNCGSAHCYPFQCADILEVWCDTIGKAIQIQPLFIATFDDLGRPILMLPLGIRRRRGIRILEFLDGGVCDYNAPIVFEPIRIWKRGTLDRFWKDLVAALPAFDVVNFDKMPAEVGGVPNPIIELATGHCDSSGCSLELKGNWEEYAARDLPYRRDSLKQRRRLTKLGEVTSAIPEKPEDRQRVLEAMMRQKSRRYMETWGFDGFDRPGYRQYYRSLIERLPWPGPALTFSLEVNGKIVSTLLGLVCGKRVVGTIISDEGGEWRRLSPGRLLMEDTIRWSFSNGIQVYDFGIGEEGYKNGYTDNKITLSRANIAVTMIGRGYLLGRDTKAWRFLKKAILRLFSTFGTLQRSRAVA